MHTTLFILILIATLAVLAVWTYRVSRHNNIRRALARCDAGADGAPAKARTSTFRTVFIVVGEVLSTLASIH